MKQLSIVLVAAAFLFACSNEKKTDEPAVKPEEKKETAAITYPYKAGYSSDFSIGDANHSKMVLDLYKMWEDNKVDEFKTLMGDSISIDFPDGNKYKDNKVDSMISFAKQVRNTLTSVKVNFEGWMPIHSNDAKEDFVLVWYREYETNMSGKVDSTFNHAYFLIKNNKIRSWSEFQQKLTPPPPPPARKK
jgi:hypothetical protein